MKKILVPTDFSKCAVSAADYAMLLAQKMEAEVHFLHVADVPVDWSAMDNSEKIYPEVTKTVGHAQRALDQLVQQSERLGLTAKKYLSYNKDYRAILEYIDSKNIDMVVMGSTGATGLKELLIGSNTQKIVRLSPVPVLVIKEQDFDNPKLDHMVFVSDFDEEVMEQFKRFVEFVQNFDVKLSLLFVNTPEIFTDTLTTKIKMGNYANHAAEVVENSFVFNSYNIMKGLQAFCKENQPDAIGMITHGSSSGLHLFNHSLTEKVVNHSEIPVLTMHFSL